MTDQNEIRTVSEELRRTYLHTCLPKADGSAQFVSDIRLPDMLEAVVVRAPVARCRIISLDTTAAEALPDVTVVTASDIPGSRRIGKTVMDQDVLCDRETYGIYDAVALVAAPTRERAAEAAAQLKLAWDTLPGVFDLEAAKRGPVLARPDVCPDSNLAAEYHFQIGMPGEALRSASAVISADVTVGPIEHCYMESDCAVARIMQDGSVHVSLGCHCTTDERRILAGILDLPLEKIHVEVPYMGGSFGGKDDGLIAAYAALLARKSGRPVRLFIERKDEMAFHTKRHGQHLQVDMAFDCQGRITGARHRIESDTGSSLHHGQNIFKFVSVNACGPYRIPSVLVDTELYYTNSFAMGAMRSWGITGITFANETVMNMAAARLGIDPLKLRILNAIRDGDRTLSGGIVPIHARYVQCLEKMAGLPAAPRHDESGRYLYGIGYAGSAQGCNLHFGHPDESTVRLCVKEAGIVEIQVRANDLGQGLEPTLCLIVSRALGGYPPEKIRYCRPCTEYPDGGPTGASRQTTHTGNAACLAAQRLMERIREQAGEEVDVPEYLSSHGAGLSAEAAFMAPVTSAPDSNGQGYPVNQYGYCVQRAEVRIDRDTGVVRVLGMDVVCDCGTVINRIGAEGQVQGAAAQGIGMALMEEFHQQDGIPQQHGFSDYLFPAITDVPPIRVHFLDLPCGMGYLQAKGLAELSITAAAPAVTGAIHDAAGIWITELPATPERVLSAIGRRKDDT